MLWIHLPFLFDAETDELLTRIESQCFEYMLNDYQNLQLVLLELCDCSPTLSKYMHYYMDFFYTARSSHKNYVNSLWSKHLLNIQYLQSILQKQYNVSINPEQALQIHAVIETCFVLLFQSVKYKKHIKAEELHATIFSSQLLTQLLF